MGEGSRVWHARFGSPAWAAQALEAAALQQASGNTDAARASAEVLSRSIDDGPMHAIDRAAALVLRGHVTRLWSRGWLPEDVYQMARRSVSPRAASLAVDAIADESERYPAATTHPLWSQQLDRIEARRWWEAGRPRLSQWAARNGVDRLSTLLAVIELIALLVTMPPLPEIVPPPGSGTVTHTGAANGVDKAVLSKVRALLAKAESTSFPDEAEALSAKAQELMSRYAIERAMVDADHDSPAMASARRVWLDNPYVRAKSLLVANVAAANRCRSVSYERLGLVTVIGDSVDLDTVELLTTSLMLQATKAMLAAGTQISNKGQSRTRSFRQSFLLAYATRIGERLRETTALSEEAAGAELVPVLAQRERAVDDLFESLFPMTVQRSYSVGNAAGWGAGRAAADWAQLSPERDQVDRA